MLTVSAVRAQPVLGMSPVFNVSPNDSVYIPDTLVYDVYVRNVGNTTFSGKINLNVGVQPDKAPSLTIILVDTSLANVTGFAPGDSLPATLRFPCDTPSFDMDINTVVIWPVSGTPGTITQDSLKDTIFVYGFSGIGPHDRFFDHPGILFPNPVGSGNTVYFQTKEKPRHVRILDAYGRIVRDDALRNGLIDVGDLPPALYLVEIDFGKGKIGMVRLMRL